MHDHQGHLDPRSGPLEELRVTDYEAWVQYAYNGRPPRADPGVLEQLHADHVRRSQAVEAASTALDEIAALHRELEVLKEELAEQLQMIKELQGEADSIDEVIAQVIVAERRSIEPRLRALEDRPSLRYQGIWSADQPYQPGDFTTDNGSLWHANVASTGIKPGDGTAWTLSVKRGRDARTVPVAKRSGPCPTDH
jgi:hypothetical protein